jgi:hypothetical protein
MALNALNTIAKQYGPEALKEAFQLWTRCQELDARTAAQAKKELEEPQKEVKAAELQAAEPQAQEPEAPSSPSTPKKRHITPEHKAALRAGVVAAQEAKKLAEIKQAAALTEEEALMAKNNIELVGIWAELTGRRSGLKQSKHQNKKQVVADILRLRSDPEYRAAECARVKNKA